MTCNLRHSHHWSNALNLVPTPPRPLVGQLQVVPARYSESVGEVLSEIGEVVAVESVVRHLELGYMGRVDCIG